MSYNDYMYAVDRSDEYLAHYGVKGMKWGVRKAIASGNSRRLDRAYRKAAKKLAKLERRANNGGKYARRAAALGAGAAAAGGLAALGTTGVSRGIVKVGGKVMNASSGVGGAMANLGRAAGNAALRIPRNGPIKKAAITAAQGVREAGKSMQVAGKRGSQLHKGISDVSDAVNRWGDSNSIGKAAGRAVGNIKLSPNASKNLVKYTGSNMPGYGEKLKRISNNTIARAGAAALGAGLAGAAGYNAYRAATTKRAAKQAQQWRSEMNKAFAGTKYASGGSNKSRNRRRKNR